MRKPLNINPITMPHSVLQSAADQSGGQIGTGLQIINMANIRLFCRRVNNLGLLLLLWMPAALAATTLSLNIQQHGDRYRMQAVMLLAASPRSVMHVLEDYRHMPRLNPAITDVRIVSSSPSVTRVETRAKLCILFLCETLHRTLDVRQVSATELRAKVIPALSDLKHGKSQWTLTRVPQGTRLLYKTEIEPKEWLLPVIGPWLIRKFMKEQIRVTIQNLEKLANAHGH